MQAEQCRQSRESKDLQEAAVQEELPASRAVKEQLFRQSSESKAVHVQAELCWRSAVQATQCKSSCASRAAPKQQKQQRKQSCEIQL